MKARRTVVVVVLAVIAIGCTTSSSGSPAATASASAAPSTPAAGAPSAIPAAIVGTWTTTITEADLRAAGVTEQAGLDENSGVFTMHVDADGAWSMTQVTDTPIRWPVFKGTSSATGPDSFRQITTFPADYAGDAVDFTWSKTDGALSLRVVTPPDEILPILIETHPWQPKG